MSEKYRLLVTFGVYHWGICVLIVDCWLYYDPRNIIGIKNKLIETIVLMVQKWTMPQIYYMVIRRIYFRKTWRSFAVKESLLMMIPIQHWIISLGRARLLLAPVIGGDRVLYSPRKPATFRIISLLSDIIGMMPSFVCHCFSCFRLCPQRTILRKSSLLRPTRGWVCQWTFKSL